jgi:ubiquinone/menaquinone biosynthesis C-methylase UbiE
VNWYQDWFGREYLSLYQHRNVAEAAMQVLSIIEQTGLKPDEQVLDIACGAGRHVIEFQRLGFNTYGIDLSETLVAEAKRNGAKNVSLADMRNLPFDDKRFSLVTSMFTSFGYFETDQEHIELLKEWRRVLKSGSKLFMDYLNREKTITALVPHSSETHDDKIFEISRELSEDKKRIIKTISVKDPNSKAETVEYIESVRAYSKAEIEVLLLKAGFTNSTFYKDYDFNPFPSDAASNDSNRLIIIANS